MTSPPQMYNKFVLANHFSWPIPEIGRKIANDRPLFQALYLCIHMYPRSLGKHPAMLEVIMICIHTYISAYK